GSTCRMRSERTLVTAFRSIVRSKGADELQPRHALVFDLKPRRRRASLISCAGMSRVVRIRMTLVHMHLKRQFRTEAAASARDAAAVSFEVRGTCILVAPAQHVRRF